MLPGFLDSTYKQYKNDTSTFFKWLLDNGEICGYKPCKPMVNTAPAAKSVRLKGKARKQAKQTATNNETSGQKPATEAPRHLRINSKEIMPMAYAVINSTDPVITVPSTIIRAGLRAVSARKRCTSYYRSQTSPDDSKTAQANDGHSYFISLLEEAIIALQPHLAVLLGTNDKASEASPLQSIQDLENRFAALEVEEPEEQLIDDIVSPKSDSPPQIYEIEVPKDDKNAIDEELVFAYFCLFDDFQRLRAYLGALWDDFAAGKVDMITAAVSTNAAFQVAIRTQDDMLVAYPKSGDYQSVISVVLESALNARGLGQEVLELDDIDDSFAEWIFASANQILDSFCDVIYPKEIPLMKRGYFGIYNPRTKRSNLTAEQQRHEDLILLYEILPEFCFIQRHDIPLFAKDELTRGLIQMVKTKTIPTWLTFATTVFLDIHHLLRDKVDDPFTQLQAIGRHAKGTLTQYFDFSRELRPPSTWPKQNEDSVKLLDESIEKLILNDIVFPMKDKSYKRFSREAPGDEERFYLYKRHPILCGICAFRLVLDLQHSGVVLCNAWGTVTYPAHLYNALKHKSQPIKSWPMMDEVVALHTEERIFVGGTPKTLIDSYKQVCLVLGYSAEIFAPNRRQTSPTYSKNGPRGLNDSSVLGELFRESLAHDDSMNLTFHNIEELLNEQAKNADLSSNPDNKTLYRKWASTKRLTSHQFLSALRTSIPIELPKLKFNYFQMHEQSIKLLRRLVTELDEYLTKHVGPMYIENESQLPFVAMYVIMIAMGSMKAAEQIGISDAGSRMLEKAGKVLEGLIDEEDAVEELGG